LQVIYIAGAEHCGSTLLDLFLGQHPDVLSSGQLSEIAWCVTGDGDIDVPRIERLHLECWSDILLELIPSQRSYLRTSFRQIAKEKRLLAFLVSRAKRRTYAAGVAPLLRAVAKRNPGKTVIVDSSKNISRAVALQELSDVTVIHLVRDGHGYVRSKLRRREDDGSPIRVVGYAVYWAMKNLTAAALLKPLYGRRYFLMRYEDFVSDPVAAIRPLLRAVEIEGLAPYQDAVRDGVTGRPLLGGNRIRFLDHQKIDADRAKSAKLPVPYRWLFDLSAGLVRKLFGY
jgi:hypothetical protein